MTRTRFLFIGLVSLAATAAVAQAQSYGQYPPGQPEQPQAYPDQRYENNPYDDPSSDGYGDYQYSPDYDGQTAAGDVGVFYRELAPYGQWVRHPAYGWVWYPRNVRQDWRPYTMGRWVNSNYGWTWSSYEPFGWATYHYGRWAFDRQIGWLWVPGTDWGPAWVAWQQGNGYVGWAPLPPQVGYQVGVGLRLGGINLSLFLQPNTYSFVNESQFLESRLDRYLEQPARNVTIILGTRNVTDYGFENDRIINRGVAVDRIERATRRQIRRYDVVNGTSRTSEIRENDVRIYRPSRETLRSVRVVEPNAPVVMRNRTAPSPSPMPVVVAPRMPAVRNRTTDYARVERERQMELDRVDQQERQRLQQRHQMELRQGGQDRAGNLEAQHQLELKAQRDLHLREQQQMRNRVKIEREAEKAQQLEREKEGREGRGKAKKVHGDRKPPSSQN
jgi:hypothetical protein